MPFLSGDEEKQEIMFEKLGDAFRYGMIFELPMLLKDDSKTNGIHFYASMAYMYLYKYITKETAYGIKRKVSLNMIYEEKLEEVVQVISNRVFEEMLNRFEFQNFEELIERLNEDIIPDWCFYIGYDLLDRYMDSYILHDDFLYYISRKYGNSIFSKIRVRDIDIGTELDDSDRSKSIGYGYDNIAGFDNKLRRVYLTVDNQEDFYHYYDMLSDSFYICKRRLLTVVDGIPFVVTRDNQVAFVLGNEEHKIKEYNGYEDYCRKKDCILVRPGKNSVDFFYPYCISFSGRVVPADIKDCRKVLWKEIQKIVVKPEEKPFSFLLDESEKQQKDIPVPNIFSMNEIMDIFNKYMPSSERCTNKEFIILENIFDILSHYINRETDITALLYTIYDADLKMNYNDYDFPSEKLYWRFKELEAMDSDAFAKSLKSQNNDNLKLLLVEDEYRESRNEVKGMIGEFWWDKDEIQTSVVYKNEGLIIGSQIVPKIDKMKSCGMVVYDYNFDIYLVISNRNISQPDRLQIVTKYRLLGEKVSFIIE